MCARLSPTKLFEGQRLLHFLLKHMDSILVGERSRGVAWGMRISIRFIWDLEVLLPGLKLAGGSMKGNVLREAKGRKLHRCPKTQYEKLRTLA